MTTSDVAPEAPYADELPWPAGLPPLSNEDDGSQPEPFAQYAWLRRNAPVVRVRTGGEDVWIVTRYEDVRAGARMHKVLSSKMSANEQPTFLTLFDAPEHTRLRKVYAAAFNPKAIQLVADRIRATAERIVHELTAADESDIVRDLCVPLTMTTIGGILDVPTTDIPQMKFWSDELLVWHARNRGLPSTEESARHTADFFDYLEDRLRHLYDTNADSVGAHLARSWMCDDITAKEAREMCAFLFMAGHDTTTFLLGNLFRVLAEDAGLLARIRERPGDAALVIEEIARLRGPVHRIVRRAVEDVELGGVRIPAGSMVRLLIASANRDEAQFADPDRFDIDRDNSRHLGFGFGVHSCIGAPLARLEARMLLEVLAQSVSSVRLGRGDSVVLTPGHAVTMGPTSLRMELTPRA